MFFNSSGVHVVCDGQFGSTGKGALAAFLAAAAALTDTEFALSVSNAGPNSGHTFYHNEHKIVLKQLPTFAVATHLLRDKYTHPIILSAGSVIDPDILRAEAGRFPGIPIHVHPNAAVITQQDRDTEHSGTIAAVAGTRSGTGAALARKVLRDPDAVWGFNGHRKYDMPENVFTSFHSAANLTYNRIFMEISQGFSLGINQRFYPKCTSRECTVSQGFADAGLSPKMHAKTYMSLRTFPIRVGDVDGHSSGDWYPDQNEVTWGMINQEPELTTVTQRIRRVATFSQMQVRDALLANMPDVVFINFLNYIPSGGMRSQFIEAMKALAMSVGIGEATFLGGYGPTTKDIHVV